MCELNSAAKVFEVRREAARLVRREQIENPLARRILAGDLSEGGEITVDARGDGYIFDRGVPAGVS